MPAIGTPLSDAYAIVPALKWESGVMRKMREYRSRPAGIT